MSYKNNAELKLMNQALVNDRLNGRVIANQKKSDLNSNDVLKVEDYEFTSAPFEKTGNSGNFLIANNKKNSNQKYLVKHEFIDCSCNEFIYSKFGKLLNAKFADVKLFDTLTPPLNSLFKSEDVVGIEYLDLASENIKFSDLNSDCKNKEDYFKYFAIRNLFMDIDSFEIVLDKNGYIYKISNSATFDISNFSLQSVYIDFNKEINGININLKEFTKKQFLKTLEGYKNSNITNYQREFNYIKNNYGKENIKYFLEPFHILYDLNLNKVDDILNTLSYFYPDYVSDYYKQYFEITKEKVKQFLHS